MLIVGVSSIKIIKFIGMFSDGEKSICGMDGFLYHKHKQLKQLGTFGGLSDSQFSLIKLPKQLKVSFGEYSVIVRSLYTILFSHICISTTHLKAFLRVSILMVYGEQNIFYVSSLFQFVSRKIDAHFQFLRKAVERWK